MSLELKKQILKITSLVFMTLILFASLSNTTLALGELFKDGVYDGCSIVSTWSCAETSTSAPMQKNCPNVNKGIYAEAKVKIPVDCIRNGNCANWGKTCAIPCPNPAGCGACECRCYADGGLKCEDKWLQDGIAMAASCTMPTGVLVNSLPSNGKNAACVPTFNITSPANNSTFVTGATITFKATRTDLSKEPIATDSYKWRIRTKANSDAGIYTEDIQYNGQVIPTNTLPAGSYYAFFSAKNTISTTGIWSDWKWIAFTVTSPPACVPNTCAQDTCIGNTCWNGCATVNGTKACPPPACVPDTCAQDTCIGNTCWNGCATVNGVKICPPPPGCSPNTCAQDTCTSSTCDNGCVIVKGTKDCSDLNWREVSPN